MKFVIVGEPASKANSRRLVKNRKTGNPMFIKSDKALNYVDSFKIQCPRARPLMVGDVKATIIIHYCTKRPDLDESVILDAMQGIVYENDRQVVHKDIRRGAEDKKNPRAIIEVVEV